MAIVKFEKFNLNQFYEKTPKPLKYILVISVIIVGSYFLYAKKIDKSDIKKLDKIEESISTTYTLINKFEDFQQAQYVFNDQILDYLEDLYTLVEELNENTNKKLDLILEAGGANTTEILEKLTLLNESYEKLQRAYTPEEFEEGGQYEPEVEITPVDTYIDKNGEAWVISLDKDGNPVDTTIYKNDEDRKFSIGAKKMK